MKIEDIEKLQEKDRKFIEALKKERKYTDIIAETYEQIEETKNNLLQNLREQLSVYRGLSTRNISELESEQNKIETNLEILIEKSKQNYKAWNQFTRDNDL